ncbi:macrolide family glycosyltransferase [Streptomyces sp. NPDC087300]|uniref:macrolide family glycosyltransferase n=1 Tax=Streptomyces sp. NPDC087300 TaxID=3365780 RepID=UPI0037FA098F
MPQNAPEHLYFVCLPAHGHVNPTLPLVAELVRRGHRVTYATHPKFGGRVEAAGATLLPLAFEMPPPPTGDYGPRRFVERMELFAGFIRAGFPVVLEQARHDLPDAVCYDMASPVGRMLAEKLALPGVGLLPTFADNAHTRRAGLVPGAQGPDRTTLRPVLARLRRRATTYGVSMASVLMSGPPAEVNVVFVPREFQYAAETFDDGYHFVGPSLEADGDAAHPDTDVHPAADGEPLVYVSLGTASRRPEFLALCRDAFAGTGQRVAMSTGEHIDPAELGTLPAEFDVRPYFPQRAVLRHAAVFVSHGGMNSIMESVHAGVPLVVVPERPEQEANARRVEELGLGRRLAGAGLTAGALRAAVASVASDAAVRAGIDRMRRACAAAGGAPAAADVVETVLAAGNDRSPGGAVAAG